MNEHHALLLEHESPLTYIYEGVFSADSLEEIIVPKLAIADARRLISAANLKPAHAHKHQLIVVKTTFIVEEAQHALLKIIEEPPLSTQFVFVVPHGYRLLDTLESRFSRVESNDQESTSEEFQSFYESSYQGRLSAIETALKQKDLTWQSSIKRGLKAYIRQNSSSFEGEALLQLDYVLRTVLTRGASNKFLFEQLALLLPTSS